ncbi:MAG: dihydroorotate dehydrogenase electron transfer subunit [Firmicutes bacterium]|nr:dihydroorotate dehydrogenase electron transfer subunit [Bacillota bacterium]
MLYKIVRNEQIGPDYFLLEVFAPHNYNRVRPGNFFHFKLSSQGFDPLLRRPLSIHDVNYQKKRWVFLYRVVGRGTSILADFKEGTEVDILGPLGNSFTLTQNKEVTLLGGGMGIAPIYYLLKQIYKDCRVNVFIGGNNKNEFMYLYNKISDLGVAVNYATIDGSSGLKGTVLDIWKSKGIRGDYLYSCGPEPMLKEIQKIATKKNMSGEFSLEERMGCGIGVCLSCVCQTKSGNKRVCKEGPVFSLEEVVFND